MTERSCSVPERPRQVLLGHGSGGRLTTDLIESVFRKALSNPWLDQQHDGAVLQVTGPVALTTDSYVVHPLVFPGGDIGSLAVHGTVNDLAMCGARPQALAAAFILEEGLSLDVLERVVHSMAAAARDAGVAVVTGDTKVVDRGKGDGIFITTTGVGVVEHDVTIGPRQVGPGDAVIVSGDVGRHGMAITLCRDGLSFDTPLESDSAAVVEPALALLQHGIPVRCLRDLTRGGLAGALCDIATLAGVEIAIEEGAVPVAPAVRGACELLGFDVLHVACEGRFVAFVEGAQADAALQILHQHPVASGACRIGTVRSTGARPRVMLDGLLGVSRIVEPLSGEQLPRIC